MSGPKIAVLGFSIECNRFAPVAHQADFHILQRGAAIVADARAKAPRALPEAKGFFAAMDRAGDWTPVLFATARDEDVDRILGLELGGDDYLVKPFNPRELVARVRAVLRRGAGAGTVGATALRVGRVRIDPDQRRVWVEPGPADAGAAGRQIDLTATEFDLLVYLARSPGRVFERAGLLRSVWGYASPAGARTVDVHVAALRAKLGDASPIRTVRGVGYAADDR